MDIPEPITWITVIGTLLASVAGAARYVGRFLAPFVRRAFQAHYVFVRSITRESRKHTELLRELCGHHGQSVAERQQDMRTLQQQQTETVHLIRDIHRVVVTPPGD